MLCKVHKKFHSAWKICAAISTPFPTMLFPPQSMAYNLWPNQLGQGTCGNISVGFCKVMAFGERHFLRQKQPAGRQSSWEIAVGSSKWEHQEGGVLGKACPGIRCPSAHEEMTDLQQSPAPSSAGDPCKAPPGCQNTALPKLLDLFLGRCPRSFKYNSHSLVEVGLLVPACFLGCPLLCQEISKPCGRRAQAVSCSGIEDKKKKIV